MSNTAMQNRQPEKIPKAMLRLMFALVVFVLPALTKYFTFNWALSTGDDANN